MLNIQFKSLFLVTIILSLIACEHHHEGLDINHPWALALPSVSQNGAAYLSIHNHESADQLTNVSSDIADKVEIHQHVNQNGQISMKKLDWVDIDEHSELAFQPGGRHIMLLGLKEPLVKGNSFVLNLVFKNAGEKQVTVQITDQMPDATSTGHNH